MHAQAEPEISVFELWDVIRKGWALILGFVAAFALIGFLVAAVMPVAFRAEVVVVEASPRGMPGQAPAAGMLGQLGGLAALAGIDPAAGRRPAGMLILRSRTFGEAFVERHDALPHLFPRLWDDERNAWREGITPPRVRDGAERLARLIQVSPARDMPGANVVSVQVRDPEVAARWANGIVELANEMARDRDVREAERSVEYLNEQMARTNVVELQRVLFGLLEQEQKTLMLANAREFYAFEVIDPALVPDSAASPNRQQVIAAGFVAGLFFGLLAVFLRAVVRSWRVQQGRV